MTQLGTYREQIALLDSVYASVGREMALQFQPACLPPPTDRSKAENWKGPQCLAQWNFLEGVWTPLKSAWDAYVKSTDDWWEAPWFGSTIRSYHSRLRDFRVMAQKMGFVFQSPPPTDLPEDTVSAVGRIVKFAVVGGILIGGLVVLYKVLPPGQRRLTE